MSYLPVLINMKFYTTNKHNRRERINPFRPWGYMKMAIQYQILYNSINSCHFAYRTGLHLKVLFPPPHHQQPQQKQHHHNQLRLPRFRNEHSCRCNKLVTLVTPLPEISQESSPFSSSSSYHTKIFPPQTPSPECV